MKTQLHNLNRKITYAGKFAFLFFVAPFFSFSAYAQTWAEQNSLITNAINDIQLLNNADTGYAVASGGKILKTTNGGLNWNVLNSGTVKNLYGVSFSSADSGFAVGDSGLVLATKDGGANWTALTSGTAERLNDVKVKGSAGFIVGNNGVVLKINNMAITVGNSGISDDLYGVDMGNSLAAIAVGGGLLSSKIIATYNGNIWVSLSSGSLNQLNDVHFTNDSTGYIVGNSGTILKTTNYGGAWATRTSGTTANLYAIDFVGDDIGYITGANGTILHTRSTLGNTWSSLASGVTAVLNGASFSRDYVGYAAGGAGTIIKTCPLVFYSVSPNDSVCKNTTLVFTNESKNATSYTWVQNYDTLSTSINYSKLFDSVGIYNFRLYADNGTCKGTLNIELHIIDNPHVSLGNDTAICNTCTITLNAGNPGSTYVWYRDGVATGVISRTNTVGVEGTYSVEVTNSTGCKSMDSIVVSKLTGITDLNNDLNGIAIYPNPNNKQFALDFGVNGTQDVAISISNYMGMTVYNEKVEHVSGQYSKKISLDGFSSGVYMVNITCNGKTKAIKMITY